jgi:hypothetical protein
MFIGGIFAGLVNRTAFCFLGDGRRGCNGIGGAVFPRGTCFAAGRKKGQKGNEGKKGDYENTVSELDHVLYNPLIPGNDLIYDTCPVSASRQGIFK